MRSAGQFRGPHHLFKQQETGKRSSEMSEEFVNPMAGKTAEEKKEFIVGKAM